MAFNYAVAEKVISIQMAELLSAFGPPGTYGTAVALYYPSLPQGQSFFYEGMANDTTPVSQDTIFAIGSLTKTFTATMFTLLNIPANMSIKNFLPAEAQSNPNIAAITFGELATHTSGMPRVASDKIDNDAADALFQDQPAPDDLRSYWQTYSGHDAGTCWTYSNIGFLTLGYALVGAAAQERYTTLLNVITNPTTGLNMPSTVVDVSRFPTDLVALGHFNGQPREIKTRRTSSPPPPTCGPG